MEYVYAAMLLHSADKEIDEKGVSAVLTAAGVDADSARVKAMVASLGSVDIGEAMATAVAAPVASPLLRQLQEEHREMHQQKQLRRKSQRTMVVASKASARFSGKVPAEPGSRRRYGR